MTPPAGHLEPYQRAELALALEPLLAAKAKARQAQAGKTKLPQISAEAVETRKEVAKVAGVSHDTIAKAKVIQAKATSPAGHLGRRGGGGAPGATWRRRGGDIANFLLDTGTGDG